LHLTEPGSDLLRERLAFRDALRADGELAAEYEALKLRLADLYSGDIRRVHGRQARVRREGAGERRTRAGETLSDRGLRGDRAARRDAGRRG
jgi:hypothetical protein